MNHSTVLPPKPSFLENVFSNFKALMASPTGRLQSKADTPVLSLWQGGSPTMAAAAKECPACGADCEQPLECTICGEACCPECAPEGLCKACAAEEVKPIEPAVAPATSKTGGILQPIRASAPSATVEDHAYYAAIGKSLMSNVPPAAPAVTPLPTAAVPTAATKPVQDRAFFEALAPTVTSNMDRWNVAASLSALDRGEVPAEFIGQAQRDEQCIALHLRLKSEKSSDEQWRIIKHLDQLEAGGNPGPFLPGRVIDGNVTALHAAIAAETDPKERFRLASQIDAVAQGEPFISRQQARSAQAGLAAELEAATTNDERFRIAKAMNDSE